VPAAAERCWTRRSARAQGSWALARRWAARTSSNGTPDPPSGDPRRCLVVTPPRYCMPESHECARDIRKQAAGTKLRRLARRSLGPAHRRAFEGPSRPTRPPRLRAPRRLCGAVLLCQHRSPMSTAPPISCSPRGSARGDDVAVRPWTALVGPPTLAHPAVDAQPMAGAGGRRPSRRAPAPLRPGLTSVKAFIASATCPRWPSVACTARRPLCR
jgi:hypothetical protein